MMNKRSKYNLGTNYSVSQIKACIDDWIPNSVYREILKRVYTDGITNQEAAEEFGYSPNNIKDIIKNCYPVIKEHLK